MQETASANAYRLLNGLLEKGLPFIAAHLGKKIKYPIVITDVIGRTHYPDEPGSLLQLDDLFVELPHIMKDEQYYYDAATRSLYLRIGENRGTAYIIITDLDESMVSQVLTAIDEDAKLAVKYYFFNLEKMRESQSKFKQELVEYLFFKSQINIRDYLKPIHHELQFDKPYMVALMEADEADSSVDWEIMSSYTMHHFKRIGLEIIPVPWNNSMIGIFPTSYKQDTMEVDPGWTKHIVSNGYKFRDIVGRVFGQTISIAYGQTYRLDELHKSYNEARIAMTLTRLMGKKNFVKQFSEMGVFTCLFSSNLDVLKKFALNTLGRLFDYDQANNTQLLDTLRQLLDNNINLKYTADKLCIHVNTVDYRIKKVEELLNIDFSTIETRVNLYMAIKVWDTLNQTGFTVRDMTESKYEPL
ncbi:MAG: hypothetical protein GX188_02140 [Syntrophomonadaceae bacterium]|jgi:hypothetical protein|nr:helix-turn-helix domain-containing protein [Thermoanaerobacterales bacterium]NLN20782.1 hypothetical protein [Syntrophomonadaceae bacterium]